jgi:hypothetical protein
MSRPSSKTKPSISPSRLTSLRAEKIAAIEGLRLTPRVSRLLEKSAHMSGDERRAMVMAALGKKSD